MALLYYTVKIDLNGVVCYRMINYEDIGGWYNDIPEGVDILCY